MNAVYESTISTVAGGLEAMNQKIRDLDASKLWLPVTIVVTIVLVIAGATWQVRGWAETVTNDLTRLDETTTEIKGSLKMIADLSGQISENTGKLDALGDRVASQEIAVQTYVTWLQTTQVALARQGFLTPDLPKVQQPKKGN